jgi:iron complex outermembrane receptor protein
MRENNDTDPLPLHSRRAGHRRPNPDALAARLAAGLLAMALCLSAQAQRQPGDAPAGDNDDAASRARSGDSGQRVEINGHRDEVQQRRFSTAAKIVVGREEIEQYGDTTVADVLKRLPSVTIGGRPGRGGQIRMRGMGNGYTQILIDGERVPRGFAIDQLSPDQIERIEIYRAPTAETGTRAIAGTINIVLREPLRQRGDDLRLGLGVERGRVQPNTSWTRNDTLGERGTYNLNLSVSQARQRTDTAADTTYVNAGSGHLDLAQQLRTQQFAVRNSFHLTGRMQWQLQGGNQFSVQPFVVLSQGTSHTDGELTQSTGNAPAPYATSASDGPSRSALGRLALQWRQRVGDATRLDLRGNVGFFNSHSDSLLDEYGSAPAPVLVQATNTSIQDHSWSLNGKLSHLLADRHNLVTGLEAEGVSRAENSLTVINGTPTLPDFGGDLAASTRRLAAYAQDEWDPSANWSAYAGLRWESIRTRSASIGAPANNLGIVLSPLAHAVWRFDAPARDQLRFSLTSSYRAPNLQNLTALPRLSTLYPAPGPNTASSADRAGNAGLLPERARGIDIALEHYLAGGGIVSVSAFRRDIQDLMRTITTLETVPWANVPRWVARPQNIGDAVTQGVEFDAKGRLDEWVQGAAPLTLRGNLSVYASHVSGVPGPDNRIDQQPRASANVGGDYRLRSKPLTLGANLNWIPPYSVQQTALQSSSYELSRVVDVFALWAFDATTRLRLSLSNVLPRNYVTGSTILASGHVQSVVSNGPTYCVLGLRLEMKL